MTRRPAFFLSFAFAMGILTQDIFGPLPFLFIAMACWVLMLVITRLCRKGFGACLAGLVFLCGAFAAWGHCVIPVDHISRDLGILKGRDVEAVCRVVSDVERKADGLAPKSVFLCEIESVNGYARRGKVLVNLFGQEDFFYGDRVRMNGKIAAPYDHALGGKMSYRSYLARQGVHALMHVRQAAPRMRLGRQKGGVIAGMAVSVRLKLQAVFFRYLSPGEAGLMTAMLLGPRQDIAPHIYDVFRKTGTAHIIAISGMNMTLTAAGVVFFLGIFCIPRVPRAVLAVVILGFYSFMAGNSAPVARSAVMAGVVILSFIMERETDGLNSLGLAALLLLAVDPGQLKDVGCQLSFVCVASLILLAPMILAPFEAWGLRGKPFAWFLVESAAVTFAAFIGSAGILAYDFGYLTPVGLIVNLPVIPLMALVTALGAAVLFTGLIVPLAACPFALCLKCLLNLSLGALTLASKVPVIDCTHISAWFVAVYYAALIWAAWHFRTASGPGAFIDKPMPL